MLVAARQTLVLAALFHDIGHICAPADAPHMDTDGGPDVGVVNHERIGADHLRALGFSEHVAILVESHVTAKRYLTFKAPEYLRALAADSTRSLRFQVDPCNASRPTPCFRAFQQRVPAAQGGPMNAEEAEVFESDGVSLAWKLRMREVQFVSLVYAPDPC